MANVNFFSPDGGTTRYPIEDTEARSRIAGQQSLLKDTVGWTGKNLLKNTATSQTINGVTFTVNDDGSVTVNGTATANIIDYFINKFTNDYFPYDTSKEYILSGCPAGGSSNGYKFDIVGESGITFSADDIGNGAKFQFPKVPTGTERFSARIRIGNGTVCNNLVFKPMLRRADITDPTYEPYHENVETMYREVAGVWTSPVSCLVGDTSATITNAAIHTTSTIDIYYETASGNPITYTSAVVTEGQIVITFASALEEAASIKLRITN